MIGTLEIEVNKIPVSKLDQTDFNNIVFGHTFTDHMFVADYENGEWKNFKIVPYGDFPISPAAATLHYGQSIFEGIKAYKHADGQISIFRPEKNFERFNKSADRMLMPSIPEEVFMQGMKQLIDLDRNWVPDKAGSSLYIRPFMFAYDPFLGVRASETYKFMVIIGPAGAYYPKPVRVKIEMKYIRSTEGGVGYAKTAGNYAASLYPTKLALDEGFDQLIWTDALEHKYIEEAGTMNVMFVINEVLITPSTRDTILDGVSRSTILDLAKSWGMSVEERKVTVEEIVAAARNGSLQEAFGAGTAATIAHISEIGYQGELFTLPPTESRVFSNKALKALDDIRYGLSADEFGWNYIV